MHPCSSPSFLYTPLPPKLCLHHKCVFSLQIKREISTMKLIRHPNVIRMYEVRMCFHASYSIRFKDAAAWLLRKGEIVH